MNIVWQVHLYISSNHPLRSFQFFSKSLLCPIWIWTIQVSPIFQNWELVCPTLILDGRDPANNGEKHSRHRITLTVEKCHILMSFQIQRYFKVLILDKMTKFTVKLPFASISTPPLTRFFLERYDKIDWTKYFVQYDRNVSKKCLTC